MNLKMMIRATGASVMLALGACTDDAGVGADSFSTTGGGTAGADGADDGLPPTTTAPMTMTSMGMDDTGAGPTDGSDGGPMDTSDDGGRDTGDDGGPTDGTDDGMESSSGDGGMESSSGDGGMESSTGDGGMESSSGDGGMLDCGNGAVDAPEQCDGLALDGETCMTQGFAGGTLACAGDCTFDTSMCTAGGVPPEWTCNPDYYDEDAPNEICDCSCGAHDPDCDVPGVSLWCEGLAAAPAGTECVDDVCVSDVPPEWTCNPDYYDGLDGCDCSCGAHDPDCDVAGQTLYCDETIAPEGTTCVDDVCVDDGGAPPEWTCDPGYYDALDGCDCSCGAHDPDCDVAGQNLYCGGSAAQPGQTCVDDVCVDGGVPGTWYCDETYYDDGSWCDCSCGAVDPDCDGTETGLYCGAEPSEAGQTCTAGECSVPASWTCLAGYYDDPPGGTQYCDCSCGGHDPDCDETQADTWCAGSPGNGQVCVDDVCQAP